MLDREPDRLLDRLFRPRSVAVVGASPRGRLAGVLVDNLTAPGGGAGPAVHLVNPRHQRIGELPCHASVSAIPSPVDLALVMVPAKGVPEVLRDCARAGVPVAIVLSSGFAETRGEEGVRLQREIDAIAADTGLRVIGPNCQGVMYSPAALYGAFSGSISSLVRANGGAETAGSGLAYVGQSGALGGAFLSLAAARNCPLTAWLSVGNQCDVTVTEAIEHLIADDAVAVVATYLEAIPEGAGWQRAIRAARAAGKRLVVLRAGRSEAGRAAAAAHTGALIGGAGAFDAVNREHGVIAVEDFDEFVQQSVALARLATVPGRRVGVVTTSGGAGILTADWIERCGLELAGLAPGTVARLSELIPDFGHASNPVDVTAEVLGNREHFGRTCRTVADDPSVDLTLIVITGIGGANAVDLVRIVSREVAGRPVAVVWLFSQHETVAARELLAEAGIPVFDSISAALRFAARAAPEAAEASVPAVEPFDLAALSPLAGRELNEESGRELLDAVGIPAPRSQLVERAEDAARAVGAVGGLAVLKGVAPGLTHKSDIGAVSIGVRPAEAAGEFDRISASLAAWDPGAPARVLVQEQVPDGLELLVSVQRAADGYPPLVSLAMGGTRTEVYRDIRTAPCPIGPARARRMLHELNFRQLLFGFRDEPPVDTSAVVDALVGISALAAALDGRLDLEVNPLIAHPEGKGATAVDLVARFELPSQEAAEEAAHE